MELWSYLYPLSAQWIQWWYLELACQGVVVTLSFNAKIVLANFECNLKDYGLPEMALRR